MSRVTFVTGFVDLARLESRPGLGWEAYLSRGRWLLSQPVELIVFAEAERIAEMKELRPQRFSTTWLPVRVGALAGMSEIEMVRTALKQSHCDFAWHAKDTPLWFVVMREKYEWLRRAAELRPEATHLGWIDFGFRGEQDSGALRRVMSDPRCASGKIRMCSLSYVPRSARRSRSDFYARHYWPVGGGFFVAERAAVDWLAQRFEIEWKAALSEGFIATDEMMLGWISVTEPERFDFYYGDHPTLLSNYSGVRGSEELVQAMAGRALADGDTEEWRRRTLVLDRKHRLDDVARDLDPPRFSLLRAVRDDESLAERQ